jgi:nucleotide-binding universal stress UspA family protein
MNTPQNKAPSKVLACVDQSTFADSVADYAAWAAERLGAPLELLHVIDRHPEVGTGDDLSGAIGVNAQEHLLADLAARDEARSRAEREAGRVFLNRLRERVEHLGVSRADMRQRHGHLMDTLVEQQADVQLVVMGRRGADSTPSTAPDADTLGSQVEQVVRALSLPVLVVPAEWKLPQQVLVAFDGSSASRRMVERLAASPLLKGLRVHLLMSGTAMAHAPQTLDTARADLQAAGMVATAEIQPGDAVTVIAQALQAQAFDLLVMSGWGHSALRSWLLGSKTTALLRAVKVPVLLLR